MGFTIKFKRLVLGLVFIFVLAACTETSVRTPQPQPESEPNPVKEEITGGVILSFDDRFITE